MPSTLWIPPRHCIPIQQIAAISYSGPRCIIELLNGKEFELQYEDVLQASHAWGLFRQTLDQGENQAHEIELLYPMPVVSTEEVTEYQELNESRRRFCFCFKVETTRTLSMCTLACLTGLFFVAVATAPQNILWLRIVLAVVVVLMLMWSIFVAIQAMQFTEQWTRRQHANYFAATLLAQSILSAGILALSFV